MVSTARTALGRILSTWCSLSCLWAGTDAVSPGEARETRGWRVGMREPLKEQWPFSSAASWKGISSSGADCSASARCLVKCPILRQANRWRPCWPDAHPIALPAHWADCCSRSTWNVTGDGCGATRVEVRFAPSEAKDQNFSWPNWKEGSGP